jgi:hypothetical protein
MLWDFAFQSGSENDMRVVIDGLAKHGGAIHKGKRAQRPPSPNYTAGV